GRTHAPHAPAAVARPSKRDEPQRNRVEIKSTDLPPLGAPPPQNAPGGGRLSLAAEATGEGDAFNLAGNPGGRGLLSGGGLGDGTGIGSGDGVDSRYGWDYPKLPPQNGDVHPENKPLHPANPRAENPGWAEPAG